MEDKLEGTRLPAHGLVFLDLSWVLALPLYLYVEPWVETWSKILHKVGFTRKARILLGLQGQTSGFPASGLRKTSFCAFQKPCGLSPLAQIKFYRTQTFRETSGTRSGEFRNPSGDQTLYPIYQTLSPEHSGVPRHVRDHILDSE